MISLLKKKEDAPAWLQGFRGRVRRDVALAKRCWFQVGGEVDFLLTPEDADDLSLLLKQIPRDVPITMLGVGSNLLVRDGGIDGVVIRLGRGFAKIDAIEGNRIEAGAAAMDANVALVAHEEGFAGLEFLVGIPGTIGGALKMNGGAYGTETADILVSADILTRDGERHTLTPEEIGFTYRRSNLPEGAIFISAIFQGTPDDKALIGERMDKITSDRAATQPVNARTGGSTFKNPEGHKAWQLVDDAGCRGLTVGGAQISEKHCNFMINTGNATAADIENLGEEVRQRVKDHAGVELEWEIKRIGKASV